MYFANYETDAACVPYLSDRYIDETCEELVRRFDPMAAEHLHPVNIEQFITRFMGLKLEKEYLSCDGSVLGANVIVDTDRFPVFDPVSGRAEYRSVKAGTVFADKSLTEAGRLNRYRFTLAHEAGHAIWHGMYYRALVQKGKTRKAFLSCAPHLTDGRAFDRERLTRQQLIEYQADRSASALLMPAGAVRRLVSTMGEVRTMEDVEDRVILTAGTFRVSDKAAMIRLQNLGLLGEKALSGRLLRV